MIATKVKLCFGRLITCSCVGHTDHYRIGSVSSNSHQWRTSGRAGASLLGVLISENLEREPPSASRPVAEVCTKRLSLLCLCSCDA